jgi:hypothetical protein
MVSVCAPPKSAAGTLNVCIVDVVPVSVRSPDDNCSVPVEAIEAQPPLITLISESMNWKALLARLELGAKVPHPLPDCAVLVPAYFPLLLAPATQTVPEPATFPSTYSTGEPDSADPTLSVLPLATVRLPPTTSAPSMSIPDGEPKEPSLLLYSLYPNKAGVVPREVGSADATFVTACTEPKTTRTAPNTARSVALKVATRRQPCRGAIEVFLTFSPFEPTEPSDFFEDGNGRHIHLSARTCKIRHGIMLNALPATH